MRDSIRHGLMLFVSDLWARAGGSGDGPLLVLLHGLGGTSDVYAGLERLLPGAWPGGWLAVDLAGHGRSPRAASYDFTAHGSLVARLLPADRDLVLLGHSMGGMVAVRMTETLPRVRAVVAYSTKTSWPPETVAAMRALASKPARMFATRDEAAERYLKQSGLLGLVAPDDPAVAAGIAETDGGWTLTQDPRTNDFGTPDLAGDLAWVTVPVTLARGSEDPFVLAEELADLGPEVVTLDGLGHNPHVEDPAAVLGLVAAAVP